MIDLLRRKVAVLALALLAWMAWSDLHPDEGQRKAEAKAARLEIPDAALAVRGPDVPPLVVADPFRFATPADGGDDDGDPGAPSATPSAEKKAAAVLAAAPAAPPMQADDVAAAVVGALRVLARDAGRAVDAWRAPPVAAPAPARPFTLLLQSTLELPGGGQARISGRTVREGELLDFLDPERPPRLAAVQGTSATVVRGDETWVLDLLACPRIDVGFPHAAGAGTGTRAPAPAAAPRPPAAAPGQAPPKGNKGYKVRKRPGKDA